MKIKEIKKALCFLDYQECPRSYNQNIKKIKNFETIKDDYCINHDFKICTPFRECPSWQNRIKCWKEVLEKLCI